MNGTLDYSLIVGDFTLTSAERALGALRYQLQDSGGDPEAPMTLWTRDGEFMFAVPSADWDGAADLYADGWIEHDAG